MHVCVVSFKECWQDQSGNWITDGGFPGQMAQISTLFSKFTLLIVRVEPRDGGMPLPRNAQVVPLELPTGEDLRRKLSVIAHMPYYLSTIARYACDADVVHVPLPGDIALLGMLVALAFRKRLIARYCSSWETTTQTTLMNRVTRQFMRRFAGGANVMLATGAGDAPPAAGMHWVFSTAISQSELTAHQPDLLRAPGQPLRIAYVGRLAAEKGVIDLIEAFGLLRSGAKTSEQLPRLTIIGDGPQRPMLTARIEQLGYRDRVDFTGQLDRAALLRQLSEIDLCVLPSLTESFCKARLDAMLCGVPIITTAVGFGREIVGHDGERGWVVPAGDPGALADRLQHVMGASIDWPAMRSRCRSFVEMHTLEMWGQQIGQICAQQWRMPFEGGKLYA